MEKTLPLEECSINQIYREGQETIIYKIPVYQRNYAWEEDEITALVKDVYDSSKKDKSAPYYIGTLVTYKCGDNEFEVIDGQQRLTTIYLMLKALDVEDVRNKLTYSARKISADTIRNLPDFGDELDQGIKNGFVYAKKAIHAIVGESECELKAFRDYFLDQVHIIRYRVPKDVDLNHYFEVMNSRGEQLEKHEIVKSKLSECLKNQADLDTFSRVWEACCEMNIYIQQAFPEEAVFGPNLKDFKIQEFDQIPKQDVSKGKASILSLLQGKIERIDESDDPMKNDKFQPIIDFPNFLLIVLKLTLFKSPKDFDPSKFSLDDKELLNEFEVVKEIENKELFAKKFAFNLLKAKYLLDNYVVHHDFSSKETAGDNPWSVQYYYKENKKRYPKNLSSQDDIQKELVHLLSMFEVSFTPKQRKNYLLYCLIHLFDSTDVSEYLAFLRGLAKKYFLDVYLNKANLSERNLPKPNAFDSVIFKVENRSLDLFVKHLDYAANFEDIYPEGNSNISLFVFNYMDYKIWKKYADELRGKQTKKGDDIRVQFFTQLGCSDFDLEPFNSFYFSRTRKSLEHFYPQAKAVNDGVVSDSALTVSQINCFGNFAMIGAEANSLGSNWDPSAKLEYYMDRKLNPISVASLKFRIMMQICKSNKMEIDQDVSVRSMAWNADDIQKHQKKMIDILCED